jgi:hypothetical protein
MCNRAFLPGGVRGLSDILSRGIPLFFTRHTLSHLMTFEVLHRSFMRLGFLQRRKSAKVAALAGLGILLARVQAVLA